MAEEAAVLTAMSAAIGEEDWDRVEELWLDALGGDPIPVGGLLEARRLLWKAGRKSQARTLLELLAESLEERGDAEGALAALRELVRLTEKPGEELQGRLEAALRRVREGSPSLEKVLEANPIRGARKPLEALETVERWLDHDEGTVVEVRGQGVGRVADVNLELDSLKVDVGKARPVTVPFGAVSKYLRILPEGSFLHRKVTDPEELAAFVEAKPGEALVEVLESLEGPADVAAIKEALDGLLPPARWTAWWGKARKHPRVVSSGSGSRLRYTVAAEAGEAAEALLGELRSTPPQDRLPLARRLAARGRDEARAVAEILEASLSGLEASDPGLAWETALYLEGLPGAGEAALACRDRLVAATPPLELLQGVKERTARLQGLKAYREARPDGWPEIWAQWLLHEEHPAVLDEIATALVAGGREDLLDASLEVVFRNPVTHAGQFIWACEAMVREDAPEPLARRMTPSVLERLPDTLTRKEFSPYRSRAKALLDGGQVAVRLILERATPEQARRFVERVRRASGVEPQRVRLLEQALAQIKGREPQQVDTSSLLVATQEAVEARRAELKQLLEVEIPRTLKGINAAAAEGDLRENFEYHMLRDRQELLSAKAAKIQRDLGRVLVLEPGAADTSSVNIGTVVHLEAEDGTPLEPLTILGQWDADVERRIYANGSGLAQRLLGRKVGDTVEVDGVSARITRIEAWPA